MNNNKYYVYEYVRLDTNEPFYIGKGCGSRWKELRTRTTYFKRIMNKYGAACIILHNNLDEQTAFQYECWYIWQLRDIKGYNLINMTDGGEGSAGYHHTNKSKKKIHDHHWMLNAKPEQNPFYGKKHSKDTRMKISKINKGRKAKKSDKRIKPVFAVKDGIRYEFISIREMSKFINVTERSIFRGLKSGKVKGYEIGYL